MHAKMSNAVYCCWHLGKTIFLWAMANARQCLSSHTLTLLPTIHSFLRSFINTILSYRIRLFRFYSIAICQCSEKGHKTEFPPEYIYCCLKLAYLLLHFDCACLMLWFCFKPDSKTLRKMYVFIKRGRYEQCYHW